MQKEILLLLLLSSFFFFQIRTFLFFFFLKNCFKDIYLYIYRKKKISYSWVFPVRKKNVFSENSAKKVAMW